MEAATFPLKENPIMTVLNIAHRGARSLAPENTLPAAAKALALGADLWELDVAVTRDGELVVLHDDTLERTSNVAALFPDRRPWSVWTFTFDELRQLDFGSWFAEKDSFGQIQAGAINAGDLASFTNVPIPTLREALEFTRDHRWRVNIEIKDATNLPGDAFVVEKVVALVQELDIVDRVVLSSFNHGYLKRARAANAEIVTAALVESAVKDPVALLEATGAQAYNPPLKDINEEAVRAVRAAGYDVLVWTVNEEDDMRRLIDWGVSGIITDFPQRLNAVLGR
ncbi:glycerophosphodiester phosphodiesterase [bacterium]|nr:MAG: glycerophosphodiester phosphodiesterase [bacterium]